MEEKNFNEEIEKYTTSTKSHADEFNKRQDKLLENDKYLKSHLEDKMDKKILDDSTTKKYELGIKNGLLYYMEVF